MRIPPGLPVILLGIIVTLTGCASFNHVERMQAFNSSFAQGRYCQAAEQELMHSPSLLGNLQAAAALRYCHEYERSSALFDECEVGIRESNEKSTAAGVAGSLGAVLINDSIVEYLPAEYDGVMVNTYKALNFWKTGQSDLARVEFNRALDRQRRARERFAGEIQKLNEEIEQRQASESQKARQEGRVSLDYKRSVANPGIDAVLRERYSTLDEFKAYPDFTNPFTTYLAGLFFMSRNDYPKAADLLKESYGIDKTNSIVRDDFACVEKSLDGRSPCKKAVWVLYENGLGPVREELRIDLPLYMVSEKIYYTGAALPQLVLRDRACSHLVVTSGTDTPVNSVFLASMDRVVQSEFRKRYPSIVARSVISAMLKTYGQLEARQAYGMIAGFGAALFQRATTTADLRIWSALPKEFQVARVRVPGNGRLVIATPDGRRQEIVVPSDRSSIVYVKQPTVHAAPVYEIIAF